MDQLSIFIYCGDDVVYEDDDYEADDVIETCGLSSGRERQQVNKLFVIVVQPFALVINMTIE